MSQSKGKSEEGKRAADKHRRKDTDGAEDKRRQKGKEQRKEKKQSSKSRAVVVDDDENEDELWVEKGPDGDAGEVCSYLYSPLVYRMSFPS